MPRPRSFRFHAQTSRSLSPTSWFLLSSALIAGSIIASPIPTGPACAAVPDPANMPRSIVVYVQPLGDGLVPADIEATTQALGAEFGAVVRVLPARSMPQSAYYPARARYRAEKLLDSLEPLLPPDGDRILGLTARDISTTRGTRPDWGMVGLASYTRPVGVVSTFRCRSGARGTAQTRERLAKIAVHEIGHTLGLRHCSSARCLMQDACGTVSICERMDGLCSHCRDLVQAHSWTLPSEPVALWIGHRADD